MLNFTQNVFYNINLLYFCNVFFMVLDLRLNKDWVVGMTTFLFLCKIEKFGTFVFANEMSGH